MIVVSTSTQAAPGWAISQDSAANAAQTLTKAAEAGRRHYVTGFEVVTSGGTAAADIVIDIQDGAARLWRTVIGAGAPRGERIGAIFFVPLRCSENSAARLVVGAGGTGVVTTANLCGYTL